MSRIAVMFGMLALACGASYAPAPTRLAEGGATFAAPPSSQPPASNERPHLRPRPAPDRFFDLAASDLPPDANRDVRHGSPQR